MSHKEYERKQLKIYIASKFSSRDRLRPYYRQIEALGYKMLSHWMFDDPDMPVDATSYADSLANNFEDNQHMALRDIEDVHYADVFLICTEDDSNTGGREVELGQALMFNKMGEDISGVPGEGKVLMRVGPMRNVFHSLVTPYTWNTAIEYLKALIEMHNEEEAYNELEWQKRSQANESEG